MDFASVDEAKAVFDRKEEITLNGRKLFLNYSKLFVCTRGCVIMEKSISR